MVGARWGALLIQKLDAGLREVAFGLLFLSMGIRLLVGDASHLV